MVLTMDSILLYPSKNSTNILNKIELKDVKSYKSYVQKGDDMLPAGFKIRSLDDMFYLCARNLNEKWSWIVTFERLMDFKVQGKSPYNSMEEVTNRGFPSQKEYETGGIFAAPAPAAKVAATAPEPNSPSKASQDEITKKMAKNLLEKEERLQARESELVKREQEANTRLA